MAIYRRMSVGCASGDAIPFYHDGTYHLFFLNAPEGTVRWPERVRNSWQHARSADLVNWEELPPALEPGKKGSLDGDGCWTGSVVFAAGKYHIFYTGYNIDGKNPQTICHAAGDDCISFVKDPANPIIVPGERFYEPIDWRDPYIFYNHDDACYWMILAGRKNHGPENRRGCVVLYKTKDLQHFEHYGTIYEPWHTNCPECPEMYKMGDFWHLSYSRFSERAQTLYRVSKSPYGPWRTPKYDGIDGRRFYAAKSLVNDEGRRFYFGWIHEREGKTDAGLWQTGGDYAIPHEVSPAADGNLRIFMPKEFDALFNKKVGADFERKWGAIEKFGDKVLKIDSIGTLSYGFFDLKNIGPKRFLYQCDILPSDCGDYFGLTIHTDAMLDKGYLLAFNYASQTVSLNKMPAPLDPFWALLSNKEAPLPEVDGPKVCEKPLPFANGGYLNVTVFIEDSMVEIFIDGRVAFCYRVYDREPQTLGVFAQDCNVLFHNIQVRVEA